MDKSERFWDRQVGSFETEDESNNKTWLRTVENTKKHLKASDVVLDFGCAIGSFAFAFASHVQEIQGIDISPKMIEAAKRNAAARQIENAQFFQGTIFDERLKSGSFSVILALNVLHFPEDTAQVMRRINELLEPGGLLISETACLGQGLPFLRIPIFLASKIGILPSMRFFKISELEGFVIGGGFQIVETERLSESGAIIYYLVATKS